MQSSSGKLNRTDKTAQDYLASIPFDRRLYRQDIEGSIAHAGMLAKQGIISKDEANKVVIELYRRGNARGHFISG
jgi:argininosuccinate lyase